MVKDLKILFGLLFHLTFLGSDTHLKYPLSGQCGKYCEGSSDAERLQCIGKGPVIYQTCLALTTLLQPVWLLNNVRGTRAAGGAWGMVGQVKDAKKVQEDSWRLETSMSLRLAGFVHGAHALDQLASHMPHFEGWEGCKLWRACKAG